ncbi:MAG: flippase-like domain-containing protein [Nitrospirae bacterium]|nr:flippase-like domain-containing protein [Nitrospirota bacterium]
MSWPPVLKKMIQSDSGREHPYRRWLTTALKAVVSLGILSYLFSKVDIRSVVESLRNLHGGYFALAMISYIALQFVGVLRWRIMVHVQGYGHAYGRLATFYFAGLFFNLFLPTSIGGDLSRCYYLADNRSDILRAMTTILADRVSGMFALICIAAVALLGTSVVIPVWMTVITVGGAVLLLLGLLTPFIFPRLIRKFELPYRYWEQPRFMAGSLAASFFIQLSLVFINMFTGYAVGIDIPWGFYFVFTPLVAVSGMIPISLNGLGVREGAYVYFLVQVGVTASQALVFAIVWLILITSTSILGGIGWVFTGRSLTTART